MNGIRHQSVKPRGQFFRQGACALVFIVLTGCVASHGGNCGLDNERETRLCEQLELAVRNQLMPEQVVELVEDQPMLSTVNDPASRTAVRIGRIVAAKEHVGMFPKVRSGKSVIYWRMCSAPLEVKVVGIVWFEHQPSELFIGVVLPPE